MPRFIETDFPGDREAFERFVQKHRGRIGKVGLTDEELRALTEPVWREHVTQARRLLEQFAQKQDPSVQPGVTAGVRDLIQTSFQHFSDDMIIPGESIPWNDVKQGLVALFEQHTPVELPDNIFLQINLDGGPGLVRRSNTPRGLMPRQVSLTIERHGLATGVPTPPSELAEQYDMSPSAVNQALDRARHVIRMTPDIRKAVINPASGL